MSEQKVSGLSLVHDFLQLSRQVLRLDAIKGLFVIPFPSAKTSEVICPRHPKAASGFIPAIAAFTASQKNKC